LKSKSTLRPATPSATRRSNSNERLGDLCGEARGEVARHWQRRGLESHFVKAMLAHKRPAANPHNLVRRLMPLLGDTLMRQCTFTLINLLVLLIVRPASGEIHLYVADHENRTVMKIKEDGTLLWSFPNNNGHDVQLLKNGNILIVTREVQEVTPAKEIVWRVGRPLIQNAEAAQRLENGHTVIADNGQRAVIELDENKEEVWRFDVPNNNMRPRPTMRQVRRIANGNTLICASTEDEVLEVNPAKEIVWRYKVPFPYLALRLENGNTLISSGDGYGSPRGWFVVEVDKDGQEVWKFGGAEAAEEERVRFPTGLARMADGTTYIAEAQGNVIKHVSPDKKIIRKITSPAMRHPCTIVVVDEQP
jgi:sugar lactone lactonase YvrE